MHFSMDVSLRAPYIISENNFYSCGPMKVLHYSDGDIIIRHGRKAVSAYVIRHGTVRIFLEQTGKTLELAELETGAIFGESALFGIKEYGANVAAKGDVELVEISKEDFEHKLAECDPVIRSLFAMLIERQRKTNQDLLRRETQEFMEIDFI